MKLRTRSIAATLCLTTSLSIFAGTAPSNAYYPVSSSQVSTSATDSFTDTELKQIEKEVETLFTRYVIQGKDGLFYVNQENVYADGAQDHLQDFEQIASLFNSVPATPTSVVSPGTVTGVSTLGKVAVDPQGAWEFTTCVLGNAIGWNILAGAPGLVSATKAAITAWNWGLAATTVARFVGPMVLKSLGGPWGLAVAFAAAAIGCKGAL